MKPNNNSAKVRPQLSNKRCPVDGELVCDGLLWPLVATFIEAGHVYFDWPGAMLYNVT
jgi:hypothetical protein